MLRRRLSDDAEDVVLAHDQESFAIDFDFGAAVFRNEDLVPFLHGEIHFLALFVHLTGAKSDHFAFLRFFFRSVGNDYPAFFCFLLFERLHQHPISERFYVNACHKLVWFLFCFCFWVEPATVDVATVIGKLFGYFFLSSSTTSNSASTTSPSRRAPSPCGCEPGRDCVSGPGCGPAFGRAPSPAEGCLLRAAPMAPDF